MNIVDMHGDVFEEGQIVTSEHHKWVYKTMLSEDGYLILRGLNVKHSQRLHTLDTTKYEIIGELCDRMRDM